METKTKTDYIRWTIWILDAINKADYKEAVFWANALIRELEN